MHPRGGARAALAFFCRISASLPLSPRPPSHPGKGGDFRLFLCKGLRPLHPRGGAGAALATGRKQGIRRGLGRFTRRVYSWCIIKIFPLSPRPPSRREGGDFRLFYARGFAPCIPGAEPRAALVKGREQGAQRGLGGDGGGGQGRGVRRGILSCFMPDSGIKVLERRGHGGGKLLSRSFPPPEHPGTPQTPYRSPR